MIHATRDKPPPTAPKVASALGVVRMLIAKLILRKTTVARCQLTVLNSTPSTFLWKTSSASGSRALIASISPVEGTGTLLISWSYPGFCSISEGVRGAIPVCEGSGGCFQRPHYKLEDPGSRWSCEGQIPASTLIFAISGGANTFFGNCYSTSTRLPMPVIGPLGDKQGRFLGSCMSGVSVCCHWARSTTISRVDLCATLSPTSTPEMSAFEYCSTTFRLGYHLPAC